MIPTPANCVKCAGLLGTADGALLGVILGLIARRIPMLSDLRTSNPAMYDAALGASVVAVKEQLLGNQQPERPTLLPGQNPNPVVLPSPPWNLM